MKKAIHLISFLLFMAMFFLLIYSVNAFSFAKEIILKEVFAAEESLVVSDKGTNIPFEEVLFFEGRISICDEVELGEGSAERERFVVTNRDELDSLWNKIYSSRYIELEKTKRPDLPEVDFNKEILIAVNRGGTSYCYFSSEIKEVIQENQVIRVVVEQNAPLPRDEDNPLICGQACFASWHVIKVPRTDKKIIFELRKKLS
jgi:hypothetical protein